MTKPIVSVALMMLYERGLFQLDDPIDRVLPAFKDMTVFVGGDADNPQTVPAERGISYRDLLTHTAGLTYGFMQEHPVDALYRANKLNSSRLTNAEFVERLGALPLRFQPGSRWSYSVATDVIGHLVEVHSESGSIIFWRRRFSHPGYAGHGVFSARGATRSVLRLL